VELKAGSNSTDTVLFAWVRVQEDDDYRETITTIKLSTHKTPPESRGASETQQQRYARPISRSHGPACACIDIQVIKSQIIKSPRTEEHPGLWLRQWTRDVAANKTGTSHRPLTASPTDIPAVPHANLPPSGQHGAASRTQLWRRQTTASAGHALTCTTQGRCGRLWALPAHKDRVSALAHRSSVLSRLTEAF
jgi:hypothetical protein